MKEMKTVVTEKHQFDFWVESFLVKTFWKFWIIKILIQGLISMFFHFNPPLKEKDLSIDILIDELRPITAEKIQFE